MALDSVAIAGPTLAALLQSALTSGRCIDGVLFGSVEATTRVTAEDAHDAVEVEVRAARVAGALACGATGSFYGGAGDVDGGRLAEIRRAAAAAAGPGLGAAGPSAGQASSSQQQGAAVLGWFSYRPGTPDVPSMREAAVTRSLQRHLAAADAGTSSSSSSSTTSKSGGGGGGSSGDGGGGGGSAPSSPPLPPVVFLLITGAAGHGGATLRLSYRAFQAAGGSSGSRGNRGSGGADYGGGLAPVELATLNLGDVLGAAHAQPPFAAPALAAALTAPGGGAALVSALERRLRDSAAASGAACDAVEGVCDALLSELRAATERAQASASAVAAARERNTRLIERLAAMQEQLL